MHKETKRHRDILQWYPPGIPALKKLRREDHKFEAYISRPYLRIKEKLI